MKRVRLGILGCGTVGGGFVRLLERERHRIRRQFGVELELGRVLVRDAARFRDGLAPGSLTGSALDVIDSGADIIVEMIGGTHTAGALLRRALGRGADVVTANKALLAAQGADLFALAARTGRRIGFEASVCGGVPVITALREGLAGDRIESISGILNGTSNYVLSRMAEGQDLASAVARAQELGFAEADPSLDLSGRDTAQKLEILGRVAVGLPVRRRQVRGIEALSPDAFAEAGGRGQTLRLVGEVVVRGEALEIVVEPRALAAGHPFAGVADERNAVLIRGRAAGEILLTGAGAGGGPTAVAVLSDVISIARQRVTGLWDPTSALPGLASVNA